MGFTRRVRQGEFDFNNLPPGNYTFSGEKGIIQVFVDQEGSQKWDFENWFDSQASAGPLFEVICEFLRNRSISRVLAAKWLSVLLNDKQMRLKK